MNVMSQYRAQLQFDRPDVLCGECGAKPDPVVVLNHQAICGGCLQSAEQDLLDYLAKEAKAKHAGRL